MVVVVVSVTAALVAYILLLVLLSERCSKAVVFGVLCGVHCSDQTELVVLVPVIGVWFLVQDIILNLQSVT